MTTQVTTAPASSGKQKNSFRSNHVPKWGMFASIGGSLAVGAGLMVVIGWNLVGWLIVSLLLHAIFYPIWVGVIEGKRKGMNALWAILIWSAFLCALIPLVSIIWTVVANGIKGLTAPGFLASTMEGVDGIADQAAAEGTDIVKGGIKHALIGTLMITLLATVISVPIGLLTSIWLVEYSKGGWLSRAITFLVDVMTGIPSIVAGLFASGIMMTIFEVRQGGTKCIFGEGFGCTAGGKDQMGLTAAIALSLLMIPVVVRTTEEMLRVVPNELREASYALGVRKWRTIVKVVIPTAISGIASGVTLAIARVAGETAPILLTAGFAQGVNWDPLKDWMTTLPVFIYSQIIEPTGPSAPEISWQRAWGAALVLVIIVMVLNLIARLVASLFAPKKSGR